MCKTDEKIDESLVHFIWILLPQNNSKSGERLL